MLHLPKETIIYKALPKSAIFDRFEVAPAARKLFNDQISRLTVSAEISPQTINIAPGQEVSAIFVVHVTLKTPQCDQRNLALLAKNIGQTMVFVLQYEAQATLAAVRKGKVLTTTPAPLADLALHITGHDLDVTWSAMLAAIGNFAWSPGDDIDTALASHEHQKKLLQKIVQLEHQARLEPQPRRKWELVDETAKLKQLLKRQG